MFPGHRQSCSSGRHLPAPKGRWWAGPWWLLLCAGAAWAQDLPSEDASREFLVGASLESSVGHIGDASRDLGLRPVWHLQLGPVRISRSRASTLLGTGRKTGETGVSADLFALEDWRFSASLRVDNGRTFDDDPFWRGLPDIRTTVRGRLSVRKPLGPRWSWGASVDHDLLGHDGGARLHSGINYTYPFSERTRWDFGLTGTWGNARYMQTHFGISPMAAAAIGRAPYALDGGLESIQLGWNASTALDEHWVLFGGVGISGLRGDAARSPLVARRTVSSATLGIAYRNRR